MPSSRAPSSSRPGSSPPTSRGSVFLGVDELAELLEHWRRFRDLVLPGLPAADVYREHLGRAESLKQVQRLDRHDPYFSALLHDSAFQALAEQLLGEPVVGRNLQYFDKPAGDSRPTPAHQDGAYFLLESGPALTLWLALEDVSEEQGCVRYVRASHRDGAREHAPSDVLGFSRGIVDFGTEADRRREVAMPCTAGQLLAHDAWTIHRAEANRSADRSRKALGFIYYGRSAREDRAAHEEYQRRLARELARQGKITSPPPHTSGDPP